MTWWLSAALACICIQFVEVANAQATGGWLAVLPRTLVPIVVAQWGLFYTWKNAPNLMTAWALFTLLNSVSRLAASWLAVGQTFDWRTPLGVAVMIGGGQLVKAGLR